jgi:transcriptional regulator with XRE-family HTH domain
MSTDEIATVIRTRRKALGLTQAETALLADVDRKTLGEIENSRGTRGVSLRNLLAIADVLGLDLQLVPR